MYVYILRLWLHNYIIIMWSVPCQIILGLRTHFILLFHRFSLRKAVHYRLLYTTKIAKLQQHWLSHQYIVVKETRPASLKTGQSQRYELWSDLCLPMAILQQKIMKKWFQIMTCLSKATYGQGYILTIFIGLHNF